MKITNFINCSPTDVNLIIEKKLIRHVIYYDFTGEPIFDTGKTNLPIDCYSVDSWNSDINDVSAIRFYDKKLNKERIGRIIKSEFEERDYGTYHLQFQHNLLDIIYGEDN